MSIEAMKQALEALEPVSTYGRVGSKDTDTAKAQQAITALRQAIEQAEQKPCLKGGQCKHGSWCSEVYCQEHCEFVEQAEQQNTSAYQRGYMDGIAKGLRMEQAEKAQPVAYFDPEVMNEDRGISWTPGQFHTGPLYTAPPQQQWQGLTRKEFLEAVDGLEDLEDCWRAIEAKLKEKNT